MIVKKHVSQDRRLILAICDDMLRGKIFEEGGKQLDLASDFYNGRKMGEEETLDLISKAFTVNAVGEESVGCCIKAGIVGKEDIRRIKKIPYLHLAFY